MEWVRGAIVGRGSFGTVNLATALSKDHKQTLQIMAVKSAVVSQSSSLRNEKEILMQLQDCPQVVRCFGDDLTTENAKQFYNLFLEYVSGGTLADRVKNSGGRLPESDVRCYARSILEGLSYIHENGFVHCDIKLQNVLVGSSSSSSSSFDVKIADFGLAKKAGQKTEGGVWLRGTPLYMSPESVARGEYEAPSDIWSLGCAVVEMITGKPAWKCAVDADISAVLFLIGFGDELPEIPWELSEEGRDFLSRCLARDPNVRWTAEMLLNHPFVAREATKGEEGKSADNSTVSPRSAFDFPQWRSLQSFSHSISSLAESCALSGGEFDQIMNSPSSPVNRIQQLVTQQRPDWSCWEDSWVTARRADSSVFEFSDDANEEAEVHMIGNSSCRRSDSLLVLGDMLGDRKRKGISDMEEFPATSRSTIDAFDPFTSSPSTSLPQFTYGYDGDGNAVPVANSSIELGWDGRSGRSPEYLESSRCSFLACKMNVGSDFLSYFGDFNCSDYYITNQYKESNFL